MKKISVFLVFVMVLSVIAAVFVSAASSDIRLVYEPAAQSLYRAGETVKLRTVAEGKDLHFSWLLKVSTDMQDYTFDLSKQAGFNGFASLDSSGKMKAKVENTKQSDGRMVSTLILKNLKFYDYGVFASCTVGNSSGYKETDTVVLFPNDQAPPMPEFDQLAEITIRAGKLLKFACNVYAPEGYSYDDIEFQWYQTPDGNKDHAVKLDDENYCVLVVDTGIPGTYYYYCQVYVIENSKDYYYESCVSQIDVYAPEIGAEYSKTDVTLDAGDTSTIKVNATVTPANDRGDLSFQWMEGDNNIPGTYTPVKGATSDTLTVKGADKAGKKYYCCIVTNTVDGREFTNESSDMPIVVVNSTGKASPFVNMDPKDTYATEGDEAMFTVDASNAVSYEWYMVKPGGTIENPNTPKKLQNGIDGVVSGADSSKLKIIASGENNGYLFYCQVYGSNGKYVSTKNAKLTVHMIPPVQPEIIKHPESVKAFFGDSITLSVTAEAPDGGSLKYQWYENDKPELPTIKAVVGATDPTFSPAQDGAVKYYCVGIWNVKNDGENGPVYSAFAEVSLSEKETSGSTAEADTSETAPGSETDVTGTDSAASDTETGMMTDGGTATDPAATGGETDKTQSQNTVIIVLLIVLICLLAAAIAGAAVFLIIKSKKNKEQNEPEPPEIKEPAEIKEEPEQKEPENEENKTE